jgi:dTMP kinase
MKKAAVKPRFIVIDGIDGTGKTTQTTTLLAYLKGRGIEAAATREPGGTTCGLRIRQILLDKRSVLSKEAEFLLFCADRAEHQLKIANLLNSGVWVISDRFLSSTWAYQIRGRGVSPELLEAVIPHTVQRYPDLTIILDLTAENALKRSISRLAAEGKERDEGRFETEKIAFFRRTREGFLEYAAAARYGEVIILDASKSEKETAAEIARAVVSRLLPEAAQQYS